MVRKCYHFQTKAAHHAIIRIDNSLHTQEWLKITNVWELSDIQVNTVHKMLLGESSNETDDKTDHNKWFQNKIIVL
jgi:hypothetical protein